VELHVLLLKIKKNKLLYVKQPHLKNHNKQYKINISLKLKIQDKHQKLYLLKLTKSRFQ